MIVDPRLEAILAAIITPSGLPQYATAALALVRKIPPQRTLVNTMQLIAPGAEGCKRLNQVYHYINVLSQKMLGSGKKASLSVKQSELAYLFVRTCLPTIVTPAHWISYRSVFVGMVGNPPNLTTMGGVLGPRQNGKSLTIAVCCAAIMISCPGVSIGCYASTLDQASIIKDYIVAIFKSHNILFTHNVSTREVSLQEGAHRTTFSCFGFNA